MKSRYKENKKKRKMINHEKIKKKKKKIIIFLSVIVVIFLALGKFVEPNMLLINDYKLDSDELPNSFNGFRIVQFSDLHYGLSKEKKLKQVVKSINSLKPDIVVFTGDLTEPGYDLSNDDIVIITKYLSKINSKLGKYSIYGNHDVRNENFSNIMYDGGFIVLKNNYDTIYNEKNEQILLYGFDDFIEGEPNFKDMNSKDINSINYRIFMIHEPDYIDEFVSEAQSNLILAGHSHKSQVYIPWVNKIYLPKGAKKYYKEKYIVNNTPVYISNGVGNSIINFRLFTPPSINLYRLYAK